MPVLSFRIDDDLHEKLQEEAEKKGIVLSEYVRQKITEKSVEETKNSLNETADQILNKLDEMEEVINLMKHEQKETTDFFERILTTILTVTTYVDIRLKKFTTAAFSQVEDELVGMTEGVRKVVIEKVKEMKS